MPLRKGVIRVDVVTVPVKLLIGLRVRFDAISGTYIARVSVQTRIGSGARTQYFTVSGNAWTDIASAIGALLA
jgi:hypothetical protein